MNGDKSVTARHSIEAPDSISKKNAAAAIVSVVIAVAVLATIFYSLYDSVKDNIWMRGELNAIQSEKEFDSYLILGTNAVRVSGFTVDDMMKRGTDSSGILKFITDQTVNIQNTVDSNFTGLYGWIAGQYMDGAGWVPDADYVATQRPWYIETMEQDGPVAYVKPYLDLDTHTVMMTVAARLSDGESVLALDISLARLQEITEEIASTNRGSIGMVLDNEGGVVAHSDENELGHQYMEETDTLGSLIAHALIDEGQSKFEVTYNGTDYMVYSQKIISGWHSVSAINADIFLRQSRIIQLVGIVVMAVTAAVIITAFIRVSRREQINRSLSMELATIADIYESVYDIDISHDTFRQIASREEISNAVGEHNDHAQERLYSALERLTDESSKTVIHEFADLHSLDERLGGHISITEEFLDIRREWCRGRFIAAERDEEGKLLRALWLVESIDAEKRSRDELLHLSETDRMTGLYNRIGGENRIAAMLESGQGGMFLLLDADKFKSINDNFGHKVGDEVLIAIANAMKSGLRGGDVVMRLGGDEFAAFAPGVGSEETANEIIGKTLDYLTNNHIEALGDRRICVSIGAAFCDDGEGLTFRQLYERADTCMYQSKRIEGSCATFYHGEAAE